MAMVESKLAQICLHAHCRAEETLTLAVRHQVGSFVIDLAQDENAVDLWDSRRIRSLLTCVNESDMRPILHGDFRSSLSCEIARYRSLSLESTNRELDLAARLGSVLIVHPGNHYAQRDEPLDRARSIQSFIDSLGQLVERAYELGASLWVENLPVLADKDLYATIFTTPEECAAILNAVPGVLFYLDLGHANVRAGNSLKMFHALCGRIAAVGVNDNDGLSDQHMVPGTGSLDWTGISAAMASHHWHGLLVIETVAASVARFLHALDAVGLLSGPRDRSPTLLNGPARPL